MDIQTLMKCPNCSKEMIEEEYGSPQSDITEVGLLCNDCELSIQPQDIEEFVITTLNPEVT